VRSVLLLAALALAAAAPAPFRGDFESGDLAGWTPELPAAEAARVVTSPVRAGRYAARIAWDRDQPIVNNGLRSEITRQGAGSVREDPDRWFAFSLLFPADWEVDRMSQDVVVQWHQSPDRELGEAWRSPPLALCVLGDRMHLEARWDARAVTPAEGPQGKAVVGLGPLVRGRWVDWVVHVRWSFGPDGLVEVWRDGVSMASRRGPVGYDDRRQTYFKTGIYKWVGGPAARKTTVARRTLFVDEVLWEKPRDLAP
jgi:hypothetical protein